MIAKVYLFSDTFNAKSQFEVAVDEHGHVLYERAIAFDVILKPDPNFGHIDDWKGSWGLLDELEAKPYVVAIPLTLQRRRRNRILATVKDCGCPLDAICACPGSMQPTDDSYTNTYMDWVAKNKVRMQQVAEQEGPKPCTCDIMLLMQAGCVCGHLTKEKK